MIIGQLTKTANGFEGELRTLTVKAEIKLQATDSTNEKAPDFRIVANGVEVGAAWQKTSKNDKPYLSLKIDDPAFAAPVFATSSVQDEGQIVDIIFDRPKG